MPNYDQDYAQAIETVTSAGNNFTGTEVWIIISCIFAVIGAIGIYIMYIHNKKESDYKGNLVHLFNFLNFKLTIIEPLLKTLYLVFAIAITLSSFAFIGTNFFKFLGLLIFGNIVLRITFELMLMLLLLAKNVKEINSKIKDSSEKSVKKTKEQKNNEE